MLAEQPSAQGVLSIRRYVLPLLTSWKQKKSPGSIALQWIQAVRFHDSSLSDTYGLRSRFRHYVLTPPVPFRQIVHREAEGFPLCQCCLQRVAAADNTDTENLVLSVRRTLDNFSFVGVDAHIDPRADRVVRPYWDSLFSVSQLKFTASSGSAPVLSRLSMSAFSRTSMWSSNTRIFSIIKFKSLRSSDGFSRMS